MSQALDFSSARPEPAEVIAAGIRQVRVYVGSSRPDQAYIDSLRAAGIAVVWIMETYPNRAQEGAAAGVYDATFAEGRANERGGQAEMIAYVVSDGSSTDPSTGAPQIASYAAGVASASTRPVTLRQFYGNRYAVDAAVGGDPGSTSWVPRTWFADESRDAVIQEIGGSPIAGTDLNTLYSVSTRRILHMADLVAHIVSPGDDVPKYGDQTGQDFVVSGIGITGPINQATKDALIAAGVPAQDFPGTFYEGKQGYLLSLVPKADGSQSAPVDLSGVKAAASALAASAADEAQAAAHLVDELAKLP